MKLYYSAGSECEELCVLLGAGLITTEGALACRWPLTMPTVKVVIGIDNFPQQIMLYGAEPQSTAALKTFV